MDDAVTLLIVQVKYQMSASASASTVKKVSKKTTAVATPAPAEPVATPAPTTPPAPEVTPKKTTKRSATPAVVEPTPVVPAPVSEPVPTSEPTSTEPTLADEMKALQDQLTAIRDSATAALASLKRLGKRAATEIKDARKNRRRARSETPSDTQKPCNFKIPVSISDELSAFLGGGKNNQMTRAQVTSAIIDYCKQRNLTEKHSINPDAPLRKLLGVDESTKLTIFNIQTYLKNHYPKPIKPTA